MRILFYTYEYPPLGGGTGNAVFYLFREYAKYKHVHIDCITSSLNNVFETQQLHTNITLYKVPIGERNPENYHTQSVVCMIRYIFWSYWVTWNLILKNQYTLSHFFGYPFAFIPFLFSWKIPYIISLRGVDVPGYNEKFKKYDGILKSLSRLLWWRARKVIANSEQFADLARETSPHQVFAVIPNGVDTKKFKPFPEEKKEKVFTVTAGGTVMGPKKGLPYLVEGFARFHKEYPNSQLVLIGTGDFEKHLRQKVNELNINKSVKFVGRKDHNWLANNLPRYHVLCLPSINEGMSNAVLEAMACGLPVIVTDTGGTKELVRKNGYIIKKRDSKDIADKLRKIYQNKKMRREFGIQSGKTAEIMSWGNVASRYLSIYQTQK